MAAVRRAVRQAVRVPAPPSEVQAVPAGAFVAGRPHVHADGTAVRYDDDVWVLATEPRFTVRFGDLPPWLGRTVKRVAAAGWLDEGRSASWMKSLVTAMRRVAEALPDFPGPDLAALTPDHAALVYRHLETRVAAADAAVAEREAAAGRPLNQRERRRASREAGGLLAPSEVARRINLVCDFVRAHDGVAVPFVAEAPEADHEGTRGVGSADPGKVLDAENRARLLRALDRELRRFTTAQRLIHEAFQRAEWGRLADVSLRPRAAGAIARPGNDAFYARRRARFAGPRRALLERYFGLAGHAPHSYGDLTAAREPGLAVPHGAGAVRHVRAALEALVGPTRARRLAYLRVRLPELLARAVKAQAVRLQVAVGRRPEKLLELPAEPKVEAYDFGVVRSVVVHFRAGKTGGDLGLPDPVPCADYLGELAVDAIATAQRLTAGLRARTSAEDRGRLFLIPTRRSLAGVPLRADVLGEYLYAGREGRDPGVLRRYRLDDLEDALAGFSLHHARHTNTTHLHAAGASPQDAARYLRHTAVAGSGVPAAATQHEVFYVAGGSDALRAATVRAFEEGRVSGRLLDAAGRLLIEGMEPGRREAALASGVPASQLSVEEAFARIRDHDILQPVPHTVEEAVRLIRGQKLVVNVTVFGVCLLPAEDGPCPSGGHACPLGIEPDGEAAHCGGGCRYQGKTPHAAAALEHDLRVMRAQRAAMAGPEWEAWRGPLDERIAIWERQLADVRALAPREPAAPPA